jgi:hypothetical protein
MHLKADGEYKHPQMALIEKGVSLRSLKLYSFNWNNAINKQRG